MKILVIKISSLGDILHSTAVLRALKSLPQNVTIDLVTDEAYEGIIRPLGLIRKFFHFNESELNRMVQSSGIRGVISAFRVLSAEIHAIRKTVYDAVIDLQGIEKSLFFYYLAKGKKRACKWSLPWRSIPENHALHAIDAMMVPVNKLFPGLRPQSMMFPDPDASDATAALLSTLPSGPLAILAPFSRWKSKDWGIERYADLAERISSMGYVPVVIGTETERRQIPASSQLNSSLMGKIPLEQLGVVFRKAKLFVGSDSFLFHVSQAVSLPSIVIFGPTSPHRVGPLNHEISMVVRDESLDCLECYRKCCPKQGDRHMACMNNITGQQIAERIKELPL